MRTEHPDDELLSKSARKREAERLQLLGRRLGELPADALDKLDLSITLRQALDDYQRFPSHGARRRQAQFIGKLMRDLNTDQLESRLADLDGESAQARYRFKQLETWRDRLMVEPAALTDFIAAFPHTDRQHLRNLIKKASQPQDEQQAKQSARRLFRYVRQMSEPTTDD